MKKEGKADKVIFTWGSLTFDHPYQVIEGVFDYSHMHTYRNFIKDVLLYSTHKKKYRKKDAGSILFLLEGIGCLLQACYSISKEKEHSLLEVRDDDMLNSNFYSMRNDDTDIWSDFPRSLSKSEMLDPYKSFQKVFRHNNSEKWYEIIKISVEYACGSYNEGPEENALEVHVQLSKLFEAAHLIYVRELGHVRSWRSIGNRKN